MFKSARPIERPPEQQTEVDQQCQQLALYQFRSCPFCIRVRREIERLGLDIEMRDTRQDPEARRELQAGGGRTMVPCLRITDDAGEITWMYESEDINRYLNRRFGSSF